MASARVAADRYLPLDWERSPTPGCVSNVSPPKRRRNLAGAKSHGLIWAVITIVALFILDQATKQWAETTLTLGGPSIHVIGDFLMFTLVYNEGGAMGTNFGSSTYYLVVALLVLPGLIYYAYRHRHDLALLLPLSFIISGAAGNVMDRIRLGRVVDFIDVDFPDILGITRWWTFNVADACISVAATYLLIRFFFFTPTDSSKKEPLSADKTTSADSNRL